MSLDIEKVENRVKEYVNEYGKNHKYDKTISRTKLRDWYQYVTIIYNDVTTDVENKNWEHNLERIKYLKIKYMYDIGRDMESHDEKLKNFDDCFKLVSRIEKIKDKEQFKEFAKYFEAIVAFLKYYKGDKQYGSIW
jgi:CRISPR-associated protein Csm2